MTSTTNNTNVSTTAVTSTQPEFVKDSSKKLDKRTTAGRHINEYIKAEVYNVEIGNVAEDRYKEGVAIRVRARVNVKNWLVDVTDSNNWKDKSWVQLTEFIAVSDWGYRVIWVKGVIRQQDGTMVEHEERVDGGFADRNDWTYRMRDQFEGSPNIPDLRRSVERKRETAKVEAEREKAKEIAKLTQPLSYDSIRFIQTIDQQLGRQEARDAQLVAEINAYDLAVAQGAEFLLKRAKHYIGQVYYTNQDADGKGEWRVMQAADAVGMVLKDVVLDRIWESDIPKPVRMAAMEKFVKHSPLY